MKKLSLLFATLLVFVSSIIFCACGTNYKNLKITCNVDQINLVLDDESLISDNILFELSGAKSWGEISIESSPSGLVQTRYEIRGKECRVGVKALQPTGDGAELIITHLGSGKSYGVALNIGMKLQTVNSLGSEFIIQAPDFDEFDEYDVKQIEIPTKQLLDCEPANYTDTIVWQLSNPAESSKGINVVSFDKDGEELEKAFDSTGDVNANKIKGASSAVKSVIVVNKGYNENISFVINPISILDGVATLHKDVNVVISIVDLLESNDIKLASVTHGRNKYNDKDGKEVDNKELKNLVLISNPDPAKSRKVEGFSGYDFYSTAIIDLTLEAESAIQEEGKTDKILKPIEQINLKFEDLYNIQTSTNIEGLTIEKVSFSRIRAIATSTCVGSGEIKVDFVPNNCIGDVKPFSVYIPCTVGERATSFSATNNGANISISKDGEVFKSTTALLDSNSLGQPFKFNVLSTHTLSAMTKYTITIDKRLLYIAEGYNISENKSDYLKNNDGTDNIDLQDILQNGYDSQIAITKDGRRITFYEQENNFVSEPLTSKNTIYMKWVKTQGKTLDIPFKISINNIYDNSYDIANNGFEQTLLTYNLNFDRQRTVESISYIPVKIINGGNYVIPANNAGNNWQFYFQPSMLNDENAYYGFKITEVLGLNKTQLNASELNNINLDISVNNKGIGFEIFDILENEPYTYSNRCIFNFVADGNGFDNIIIIGQTGDDIAYGDYSIEFGQNNNSITSRNIRIYKSLADEDIKIKIPTAEFEGGLLQYQYVATKPDDWDTEYSSYYEYVGGQYVLVKNSTWSDKKMYYKKVDVMVYDEDDDEEISLTSENAYILATSKQYLVDIAINYKEFSNYNGLVVESKIVAGLDAGAVLDDEYISNLCGKDDLGNEIIKTNNTGSFNTLTNKKNYIKASYIISTNTYDYYKLNTAESLEIVKDIYIYVYEPLTSATFDSTRLYKYSYEKIPNSQLREEYSEHNLNIQLNNANIFNYVDIGWSTTESSATINKDNGKSANIVFDTMAKHITGRIIATITQFGIQYPIYCDYEVREPVLSEQVILNTPVNHFSNGNAYINLKVGQELQIDAEARSNQKGGDGNLLDVSLKDAGFNYIICSMSGYSINGVASIGGNGLLTGVNAGRAKLIIVPKDVVKAQLSGVTNYFNVDNYIQTVNKNKAYLIIDIVVSDGSKDNPFLIASAADFTNIKNDYYYWDKDDQGNDIKVGAQGDTTKINNYHYALVGNIDLGGQAITFNNFSGTISSFKQSVEDTSMYTIYGVMLNESNPNLFTKLSDNDDGLAVLSNINFHIDINYQATQNKGNVLIGLVGTNEAKIENVTITINGKINAENITNRYIIGSMVAVNAGEIYITNTKLVGVQGRIEVYSSMSNVILGGVIGENQGLIEGANIPSSIIPKYIEDDNGDYVWDDVQNKYLEYDGNNPDHENLQRYKFTGNDVEYEVYYDNQGATADIELQVKSVKDKTDSAIGGVIGYNTGKMTNVYSTGKILGTDDAKNLTVDNIGGLIGKNENNENISINISTGVINGYTAINTIEYTSDNFQIVNSYSSAQVVGKNNVGGAVGYDNRGSYKKVYYEIYASQTGVKGNNNVGGLIGYAKDSNLYYCYSNSFALNYKESVTTYDIISQTNVGGLIGLAESSRYTAFNNNDYDYSAMNIVSSASSVSIKANNDVGGIVGRLNNYGAIYTAYFYGVINSSGTINPMTNMYNNEGNSVENIAYNNVYAIVNGEIKLPTSGNFYQGTGFATNPEYNNGYPYIVYKDGEIETNLVSVIPTKIEINLAFEYFKKWYKDNNNGDYVKNSSGEHIPYNPNDNGHIGKTRYSLMAEVVDTGDTSGNNSDYRTKVLVLYNYQFVDMSGEHAIDDLYELNTIDMHKIVNDKGIKTFPSTLKRFNLRSSNESVISILSGGRLLLNREGQATITLISTLNPSVSASFVVVVRTKVLEFNLYSNATLRDEYNLKDSTINIVKNSSKIIYADYSSTIQNYMRTYAYKSATNMKVKFSISYSYTDIETEKTTTYDYDDDLQTGKKIRDHIKLNGEYENGEYTIPYGTPITITVDEYIDGVFTITATPYVVVNYKNGTYSNDIEIELDNFKTSFNVATKKGVSAINANKTQINMMPADEASGLGLKLTTDVKQDKVFFEIESVGDIWETVDINNPNEKIRFVEMLKIMYNGSSIYNGEDEKLEVVDGETIGKGEINISSEELRNFIQSLNLTLDLNDKANYVDVPFRLQLTFYVLSADGSKKISTTVYIDVKPQAITSVLPLNYRIKDGESEVKLDNAYQSQVIRPGSTNIITIDIAPNIAVYDYVEIVDTTTQDKIFFQQVYLKQDGTFGLVDNMDTWVDSGIKLIKYNSTTSKLYLLARLPLEATANITHTVQIQAYDKENNIVYTNYLNLEAIMYPRVKMTYTDPNGKVVAIADTANGDRAQQATDTANLAIGVEAEIDITTYSIDEGTLKYNITITDTAGIDDGYTDTYKKVISLEEESNGKYILRFDNSNQALWNGLVGKKINVSFTASKRLNGIIETCKATIEFTIRSIVIHNISMTHVSSKGNLYGDWGEDFKTEFYFNYTDISYYYKGYWNAQYKMENTNPDNYVGSSIQDDMRAINDILKIFNDWDEWSNGILVKLKDKSDTEHDFKEANNLQGITIKNENNEFIINAKKPEIDGDIDINDLKLNIEFQVGYNTNHYPILVSTNGCEAKKSYGFSVSKKTTPFDEYIVISTQQEFEDMLEGKYYKLANDITFENYTPNNTAIGGLNGDGRTITIASFNQAQLELDYSASAMYIGVFGTLAENSVVQNLQVCYGSWNATYNRYDALKLNFSDSSIIEEQHTNEIYFGGVAGLNLGVITNVRVFGAFALEATIIGANNIDLGGITAVNGASDSTKVATITGSVAEIEMSAMALIGGISGTNYGKITNTGFTGKISSDKTNQYVAEVTTAGFVVENLSSAYISLSYIQTGLEVGGYNIKSVGRTAGFVLNNAGTINNCYINQTAISSQGNIGGFVYQSTGDINNCYAYPSLGNSLFYSEFIYSTSNIGNIKNCYVVTDNSRIINIRGLSKIETKDATMQDNYNGFVFAQSSDGVWAMSSYGPYLQNSGFNSNRDEYDNIYNIYDLETYDGYFERFEDVIEGKKFRLVRDIDFKQEGYEENPITSNKTLMANLEGNDMAIKNHNIYKVGELNSIGLFKDIGKFGYSIYVRNLILQPISVKASNGVAVGALAGTIDSVKMYNIVIDNQNMLILGRNAVGGLAGIIKGSFEIMGINSNVSTFATYTYNLGDQYNLYTGKNVTKSAFIDNLDEVSYAGSIAGIINGYNNSNPSMSARTIDNYYTVDNIDINGDLVIIAETVGGAFGLVGERSLVKNINYNLSGETLYKGMYVSGGLVGENRGIIQNSNIYAYEYISGVKTSVSTISCFDTASRVNGAIAGVNVGGLIDKCASDIDVCSTDYFATVGGIVGRNIEGSIFNCEISGAISGLYAGGIAGTDYDYDTIIKQVTGFGTATFTSSIVYKNIKNGVQYETADSYSMYKLNKLTHSFITKFIVKKNSVYRFNDSYNGSNGLVNASSILGLGIGLSSKSYTFDCNDNSNVYNNYLTISLARGTNTNSRTEYEIEVGGETQIITPIQNITTSNLKYDSLGVMFMYVIAYDKASFEFWSTTMGYTKEYIAFSQNALQEHGQTE